NMWQERLPESDLGKRLKDETKIDDYRQHPPGVVFALFKFPLALNRFDAGVAQADDKRQGEGQEDQSGDLLNPLALLERHALGARLIERDKTESGEGEANRPPPEGYRIFPRESRHPNQKSAQQQGPHGERSGPTPFRSKIPFGSFGIAFAHRWYDGSLCDRESREPRPVF